MKGGFLDKAIAKEAKERPKKEELQGTKEWDETTIEGTAKVLEEILMENNRLARNDLERRIRSGTGVRDFRGRCAGMPDGPLPGEDDDVAARMLREYTRPAAFLEMVEPIMNQATKIFTNVKEKGAREGMATMDSETEVKVLRDVIKECLIRHILKKVNEENSGSFASGSHDAGLLATPQGYPGELNSFGGECLRGLMEDGYGYQDDFVDEQTCYDVLRELEYMDYDGKLTEVQQQKMTGYRTDRICWLTFENLDREKQPGLVTLMKKMISIPFELNKKCSLYLQASGNFQIACYPPKAYYKRHVDGGYEDLNNGRKITALFYPNHRWSEGDDGKLRVYKRGANPFQIEYAEKNGLPVPSKKLSDEVEEEVEPRGGRLVLFRARDIPHEVLATKVKRYAITLWLMGPPGPGDMPEGHHAAT